MTVKVQAGQTLLDIAIQELGSADAVAALAFLNELDITAEITAGQVLKLPEVTNKRVVRALDEAGIFPATHISEILEGIDYWGIEYDFIVS